MSANQILTFNNKQKKETKIVKENIVTEQTYGNEFQAYTDEEYCVELSEQIQSIKYEFIY